MSKFFSSEVGYETRFENRIDKDTKIKFMIEGILFFKKKHNKIIFKQVRCCNFR